MKPSLLLRTARPGGASRVGLRGLLGLLGLLLTTGCSGLLPKPAPAPAFYAMEGAAAAVARGANAAPARGSNAAPTLTVQPPQAGAGYDSRRIIYTRKPHQLEYFATSEWVDTPARMLTPLIVAAVQNSGAFSAVLPVPAAVAGDLRLDTQILRLQQDFGSSPSRVRLTLRATLVDSAARRVLAVRDFDETVAATSEDAYGGVIAAHVAVARVLEQLAEFSAQGARGWLPATLKTAK